MMLDLPTRYATSCKQPSNAVYWILTKGSTFPMRKTQKSFQGRGANMHDRAIAGAFVTETLDYDGGRQVTVYVPPDPPEVVVFAGDGRGISRWGGFLEAAAVPSTMIVGVHGLAGNLLRTSNTLSGRNHQSPDRGVGSARGQAHFGDGGDARQRLAPKPERAQRVYILDRADLARRMAGEGQLDLVGRDPVAIVGHADQLQTTA